MNVILYMAITANGMIAKKDGDTPWSPEEFKSYFGMVRKYGNLIVGNKTHPLFYETDFADMGNPVEVVLTRSKDKKNKEKLIYVNSANEALDLLKQKGFETVLVTGGAETNIAFMRENLIDEIYLDVEPLIFGEGLPLFSVEKFEYKLKLLKIKNLSDQTIQLHYKVIK